MPIRSLKDLNEKNRQFWEAQQKRFAEQMANDSIRTAALIQIEREQVLGFPIRLQTTLEQALENEERTRARVLSEAARKAGKVKKEDALQQLIDKIVQSKPGITARQLEQELRARQNIEIVSDFDEEAIYFDDRNGRTKDAKISGLKDRLSRAKAKLKSR